MPLAVSSVQVTGGLGTIHVIAAPVGIGYGVQIIQEAEAKLSNEGLQTAILNARFVKPLDEGRVASGPSSDRPAGGWHPSA